MIDTSKARSERSLWRARLWVYALEAVILLGFVGLMAALIAAIVRE